MPSPFPGMNPYLEQPGSWMDFHQSFAIYIRNALVQLVKPKYVVRVEERLYLSEWPEDERGNFFGESDVSIHDKLDGLQLTSTATATLESPLQVLIEIPEAKTGLNALEIRDRYSHDVITVIEILSPSNKYSGDDRAAYLEKRAEILRTKASLVELDLLRGGPKLPSRGIAKCDYHILVSRPSDRPNAHVWPFDLRDKIPVFPVPLREGEMVQLDLKPILDRLYDEADYASDIYNRDPVPQLSSDDAAWAEGIRNRAISQII